MITEFDPTSLIGIIISSVALFIVIYRGYSGEIKNMVKHLGCIDERLERLETKIEPFWEIVCKNLLNRFTVGNPISQEQLQLLVNGKMAKKEIEDIRDVLTKKIGEADFDENTETLLVLWFVESKLREIERHDTTNKLIT